MAVKLNTEFNYRYQVIGDTPWEKIKTLNGFLEGRVRAAVLEEVSQLKYKSKLAKLKRLENESGLEEDILELIEKLKKEMRSCARKLEFEMWVSFELRLG